MNPALLLLFTDSPHQTLQPSTSTSLSNNNHLPTISHFTSQIHTLSFHKPVMSGLINKVKDAIGGHKGMRSSVSSVFDAVDV